LGAAAAENPVALGDEFGGQGATEAAGYAGDEDELRKHGLYVYENAER
jgi:hypothetical protein